MTTENNFPLDADKPLFAIICGKKGSGKTQLLLTLMTGHLRKKYDEVYMFSPSIMHDEKFAQYLPNDDPNTHLFQSFSQDKLKDIFSGAGKDKTTLVVLDDCVTSDDFSQSTRNTPLTNMVCQGRNRKISVIITTQFYAGVPKRCRINADYLFLFHSENQSEVGAIYQEFGKGSKDDFQKLIDKLNRYECYCILVNERSKYYLIKP